MPQRMFRSYQGLLLLGLCIFFVSKAVNGQLTWYINSRFVPPTIVGMIFLTMVVTSFRKLDIFKERNKDVIQKIALWILIGFGLGTLVLALFGIRLYPIPIPLPVK